MEKILYLAGFAALAWFVLKRLNPQDVRAGDAPSTFLTDLETFAAESDAALESGNIIDYYKGLLEG